MIDLNPYFAMIPTGQTAFDSALKTYLELLKSWESGSSFEGPSKEEARASLQEAAANAELSSEIMQQYEELMTKTKDLRPPSENKSDATGAKPIT